MNEKKNPEPETMTVKYTTLYQKVVALLIDEAYSRPNELLM
jgi:hypothetical protein